MNYDIDVLQKDVKWFMQYCGYGETTVLSLYTKSTSHPTRKKMMKVKQMLDVQADGSHLLIMCKSAERKKDFKVAGYVESFGYEEYNEELNTEGENIWLLNTEFLTLCIIYTETHRRTKTPEESAVMLEGDYKAALQRVKIILVEAKEALQEVL